MLNIRPVSDLRNRYTEIEDDILRNDEPVFLTKNGYGSLVVMSLKHYSELTDEIELKLNESDYADETDDKRYSAEKLFGRVKKRINEKS